MHILFAAWISACSVNAHSAIPGEYPAPDSVPPQHQVLYDYLNTQISTFRTTLNKQWDGSTAAVDFSAELHGANSNRGSHLLQSTTYSGILTEIGYLQAIGVKAIRVAISFPVFSAGYYTNPADAQRYVAFYKQLAADVRSRGLKLIVETGPAFHQDTEGNLSAHGYMKGLSQAEYEAGRAATAAMIATQIRPDYLTVMSEPDTESIVSGKPSIATISGAATMLSKILHAVKATGVQGVFVGAGIGSWMPSYNAWIQLLCGAPLDYVDVHIFPVTGDFLTRLFSISSQVRASGKRLAVSQAWLFKTSSPTSVYGDAHRLDAFGFWTPLDSAFVQTLVDFAHYSRAAFITPFWVRHFRAYLDYNNNQFLPPADLEVLAASTSAAAESRGKVTMTGAAYAAAIAARPDHTPPAAPSELTATAANAETIYLSWSASRDDVGVLGYRIYCNGTQIDSFSRTWYLHTKVPGSASNTYTVAAYDVAGNVSAMSNAVTQSPLDKTAPSIPGDFTGTGVSAAQVRLNWTASTDTGGVAGYIIRRGTTPSALAIIASSAVNEYIDSKVIPATKFYYAVSAYDKMGNISEMTAPIAVAVPADMVAPSVPTAVKAEVLSMTRVALSWAASTDNWRVAGYKVFRGKTPASMVVIGGSATTSYTDNSAQPGVANHFAVAAFDVYGNTSAMSAPIVVHPPADTTPPTTPTTLTAQVSGDRVILSWSPASDNVRVSYYVVWRGATPVALVQASGAIVGTTTTLTGRGTQFYAVSAYDTSSNGSPRSEHVQVSVSR